MAIKIGKFARVVVGGLSVAETGIYALSGFTRDALDSTAFGDDVKEYTFGVGDAGEISFSGNYDPTDVTGQNIIESACLNASVFTGGNLRFYLDSTSYLRVDTGGTILITKCKTIGFDKAGIGTIKFSGKISSYKMIILEDVSSASPSASPSSSPSDSPSNSPSASPSASSWQDSYGPYTLDGEGDWGLSGRNIRWVIPASLLSVSGSKIRVTVDKPASANIIIGAMRIGEQAASGDAYDFAAAPTLITWDGGSTEVESDIGPTKVSDEITFDLDATKTYVISFFNVTPLSNIARYLADQDTPSATGLADYYLTGADESATADVSGYTTGGDVNKAILFSKIEVFA